MFWLGRAIAPRPSVLLRTNLALIMRDRFSPLRNVTLDLMHPPQLLNRASHILHARPKPFANQLLFLLVQVQESLNHLAVYEPERRIRIASLTFEGAPKIKIDVARSVYKLL